MAEQVKVIDNAAVETPADQVIPANPKDPSNGGVVKPTDGEISNPKDPKQPSKGLGDTIEKITIATGIKAAVEKVSKAIKKDCGCAKRRETLNKMFPYKKKEDQADVLKPIQETTK